MKSKPKEPPDSLLLPDALPSAGALVAALKAGVSIGSLYQYVPKKDALIGALILRETTALIENAEIAGNKQTGEEILSNLICHRVEQQSHRPTLARLLDFEGARLPFDAGTMVVKDRFLACTRDAIAMSDVPQQRDPDVAALDVLAIIRDMVDAEGCTVVRTAPASCHA